MSNATTSITKPIVSGSVPPSNASGDFWDSPPAGQWSIEAAYSGDGVYPTTFQCFAQNGDGRYEYFTIDTLSTTRREHAV
ncbi:MAG: hypothetical protein ACLP50_36115 [Solirubrobacteraceae bacterium]